MAEHTKEPWSVHSGDIWQGEPDNPIVPLYREIRESWSWHQATPEDEREANARRIVACVNACAGMADPAAEIASLRRYLAFYKQSANDLAASLEEHARALAKTGGGCFAQQAARRFRDAATDQ